MTLDYAIIGMSNTETNEFRLSQLIFRRTSGEITSFITPNTAYRGETNGFLPHGDGRVCGVKGDSNGRFVEGAMVLPDNESLVERTVLMQSKVKEGTSEQKNIIEKFQTKDFIPINVPERHVSSSISLQGVLINRSSKKITNTQEKPLSSKSKIVAELDEIYSKYGIIYCLDSKETFKNLKRILISEISFPDGTIVRGCLDAELSPALKFPRIIGGSAILTNPNHSSFHISNCSRIGLIGQGQISYKTYKLLFFALITENSHILSGTISSKEYVGDIIASDNLYRIAANFKASIQVFEDIIDLDRCTGQIEIFNRTDKILFSGTIGYDTLRNRYIEQGEGLYFDFVNPTIRSGKWDENSQEYIDYSTPGIIKRKINTQDMTELTIENIGVGLTWTVRILKKCGGLHIPEYIEGQVFNDGDLYSVEHVDRTSYRYSIISPDGRTLRGELDLSKLENVIFQGEFCPFSLLRSGVISSPNGYVSNTQIITNKSDTYEPLLIINSRKTCQYYQESRNRNFSLTGNFVQNSHTPQEFYFSSLKNQDRTKIVGSDRVVRYQQDRIGNVTEAVLASKSDTYLQFCDKVFSKSKLEEIEKALIPFKLETKNPPQILMNFRFEKATNTLFFCNKEKDTNVNHASTLIIDERNLIMFK